MVAVIDDSNFHHAAPAAPPLTQRRPWFFSAMLAFDWLVAAAAIAVALKVDLWWVYGMALLVVGNRQHAIGVLGHDLVHNLGYRRGVTNRVVGELACFFPLAFSFEGYRRFHKSHHLAAGNASDPESTFGLRCDERRNTPARIVRFFFLDLVGAGFAMNFRMLRATLFQGGNSSLRLVSFWAAALGATAQLNAWPVLAVWGAALMTTFPALMRLRVVFEHTGIEGTHRLQHGRLATLLFLPHNIGFHYEHHRWPGIPWFSLPAARRLDPAVPIRPVSEFFADQANPLAGRTEAPVRFQAEARSF